MLIYRKNAQIFIDVVVYWTFSIFRLLTVDESVVFNVRTIKKLRALYDNYKVDASMSENNSPDEQNEENEFIDAILDTQVMKTAMNFLHRKGKQALIVVYFLHKLITNILFYKFNRFSWFGSRESF